MSGELEGKKCLVLGGGSIAPGWGIGKAIAVSFAREGASVVVCDRNLEAADETRAVITGEGGTAFALQVDVCDENALEATVRKAAERLEGLDVLHNNVGTSKPGPSGAVSAQDWRMVADANVLALHVASQAALPYMQAQKNGVVLNVSTIAALRYVGHPHLVYGVTKAAVLQFSRLMAVEYAPDGVRFNTIIPGLIETPRIKASLTKAYAAAYGVSKAEMLAKRHRQVPLGYMGNAWDIANAAVFLASDKARYITGAELLVDGGITLTMNQ